MTAEEKAESFYHKRLGQRAAIVVGGPLANFLLAVVVFSGLFATLGQPFSPPVIGEIVPDSAAEAAGLQAGDRIITMNGREIRRFEDIPAIVKIGLDEPLDIVFERGGERLRITTRPNIVEMTDNFGNVHRIGLLGIRSTGQGEIVEYDVPTAIWVAIQETYNVSAQILKTVWQMIAGTRPGDELGGILRIGKVAGDAAKEGALPFINLVALLSINLGLLNLFPIPLLDGGHLAFYAVEAARGRPLGERAQEWGLRIGVVVVVGLMLFATWNDLVQLKVVEFIRNLVT
jgi:regulator of sigma E protease